MRIELYNVFTVSLPPLIQIWVHWEDDCCHDDPGETSSTTEDHWRTVLLSLWLGRYWLGCGSWNTANWLYWVCLSNNDDLFDKPSKEMLYILKTVTKPIFHSQACLYYYDAYWYQGYLWNYREDIPLPVLLKQCQSARLLWLSAGMKHTKYSTISIYPLWKFLEVSNGDGNLDEILVHRQPNGTDDIDNGGR